MTQETSAEADKNSMLLEGNVLFKYDDMMMRRKTAALCGQPRVAQRLDRQINILRAALGMTPLPPIPVRNSGRAFDQNVGMQDGAESPWNLDWMKQCTASCLASFAEHMNTRGFRISRSRLDNGVTRWVAEGSERGRGSARYELDVLDGTWCTSARRNGVDLGLFDTASAKTQDGVIAAMASDDWDQRITGRQAQAYARCWSRLVDISRGTEV